MESVNKVQILREFLFTLHHAFVQGGMNPLVLTNQSVNSRVVGVNQLYERKSLANEITFVLNLNTILYKGSAKINNMTDYWSNKLLLLLLCYER